MDTKVEILNTGRGFLSERGTERDMKDRRSSDKTRVDTKLSEGAAEYIIC